MVRREAWAAARDVAVESARMQARLVASVPFTYVASAAQPPVLLLLAAPALEHAPPAQVHRIVLGTVLMALWGATVWNCGMFLRWDVMTATMPTVLSTPADPRLVALARSVGSSVFGVVAILVSATATLLVLRVPLPPATVLAGLLAAPVAALSGGAVGLVISAVLIVSREAQRVAEVLIYPVFVAGGLLVPASLLPVPLRHLSDLVSLHWVLRFTTELTGGRPAAAAAALLCAVALTAGYLWLGVRLLGSVLDRLRHTGTVGRA